MRTVNPKALLKKFKEVVGEKAFQEFENNNKCAVPMPDNVEQIKLGWTEALRSGILRITEANGCRQQDLIVDFSNEIWEIMEDLYETYEDITIFDSNVTKSEEFENDAKKRFKVVEDKYNEAKKCNFLHGTLTCYCNQV